MKNKISWEGMWIILNSKLIRFTKLILDIMFFGGFLVLITLPFSLKFLGKYYSARIEENFFFMLIALAICGVFGILIIAQLRRMMRTVIEGNCFVYKNVASLHKMALFSIFIAAIIFIKLFIMPTPATAIIVLVFFIAALFSQVLSHVFEKAVSYKEENDLTI